MLKLCCRDILTVFHATIMRMLNPGLSGTGNRSVLISLLFILFFLLQCFMSSAQTKTVIEGDIIVGTKQTSVIAENDTLIITGSLELKQGAILTIEANAVCIIYGDLIVKNSVNLSVGAKLIVGGNFDVSSASGKVVVDTKSSEGFYVLGTVTYKDVQFTCDNTSDYNPPGDENCNYGDIISLEDNENDSTGIYDLFVSGDGNKGVTPVYSELCNGDVVEISALYSGSDATYQWCDSIGNPIVGETGNTYNASQPGEYFVKITTSTGTVNSYRAKVVVSSLPAIYSAWNNDGGVICAGGTANIGASASSDVNWYAGSCNSGVWVGTGSSLSVSPDTTTTYFARAFNPSTGCESDDCKSVVVTVNKPPTIELGTMPVIETKVGKAYIPYISTTGSPTNYSIDFDAISEAAGFVDHSNYTVTADYLVVNIPEGGWRIASGTYYGVLTLKTYNPVECESIGYPVSITIVEAGTEAAVSIVVSDNEICEGEEVLFTATPTNGGSSPGFKWQVDGVDIPEANSATFVSSALTNGQKITCVMTSNRTGATNSPATSNEIIMSVNPLPNTGEIIPD